MGKYASHVRVLVSAVVVAGICLLLVATYWFLRGKLEPTKPTAVGRKSALFALVPDKPDTIRIAPEAVKAIALKTTAVEQAPRPDPLRLPGSLGLDPNLLAPVHSRFPGEVARLATVEVSNGEGKKAERRIRYGDSVKQGQILAVVWSKDIGEKKSELVDALSRLDLDQRLLQRLSSLPSRK